MLKQMDNEAHFFEQDFANEEVVLITNDVYSMTIAANMTKNCPPIQLMFCIRYCIIVFLIQTTITIMFMWEFRAMDNFQPFYNFYTAIRLITVWLMQMTLFEGMQSSLKMLTYLKRMKGNRKNLKGRFVNIIICSLKLI